MENKFGSVIFDDPALHDSGWATVWDGINTRPVRISGTKELSSGTVWLTNLSYDMMNLSGLNGSRFRRSIFFHSSIERYWDDVGIGSNELIGCNQVWSGRYTHISHVRAVYSSWLFRSVVNATNAIIPMISIPGPDLLSAISDRIIPAASRYFTSLPSDDALDAASQADLAYQPVAKRHRQNGVKLPTIRLRINRVSNGIKMLSVPFPVGKWTPVLNLKEVVANIDSWLEENPMSMIRLTVVQTHERFMEDIINFGATLNEKKTRQYQWVTSVDLVRLLPYCEVKIHGILASSSYLTGFDLLERAGLRLDADEINVRSAAYSFNIFMDMLWRTLTKSPADYKPSRPLSLKKNLVTPMAAFIRSYDRAELFPKVAMMQTLGWDVEGYGSGSINLSLKEDADFKMLANHALECGLFPPFTKPGLFSGQEAIEAATRHGGHNLGEPARRLEAAFLMGDLQTIIDMDETLNCWTSS